MKMMKHRGARFLSFVVFLAFLLRASVSTGETLPFEIEADPKLIVDFQAGKSQAAVCFGDGTIRVFDIPSGQLSWQTRIENIALRPGCLTLDEQSKSPQVAIVGRPPNEPAVQQVFVIGPEEKDPPKPIISGNWVLRGLDFSRDGKTFWFDAINALQIVSLDISSGATEKFQYREYSSTDSAVLLARVSQNGETIVTFSNNKIAASDRNHKILWQKLAEDGSDWIPAVRPAGQNVAVEFDRHSNELFALKLSDGQILWTQKHVAAINNILAVSDDGSLLAVIESGKLEICKPAGGSTVMTEVTGDRLQCTFTTAGDYLLSLPALMPKRAASPSGRTSLGRSSNAIDVIDTKTGKDVRKLE